MDLKHTPWASACTLLSKSTGSWQPTTEKSLAEQHTAVSLRFLLARIADVRPPLGQSVFIGALQLTPGTALVGDNVQPMAQDLYDSVGASSLRQGEEVLGAALARHSDSDTIDSLTPVDTAIPHYLTSLMRRHQPETSPKTGPATAIDARGIRDVIGAISSEQSAPAATRGLLRRILGKADDAHGHDHGAGNEAEEGLTVVEMEPQWLSIDALQTIDVARIISLSSWEDALSGLSPRVSQLLWTASNDPAGSPGSSRAPYRPAHDPEVLTAFARVPYAQRSEEIRNGIRTLDAALFRAQGRDPVNDHAAARLRAVSEAVSMWPSWQEELRDGTLAANSCIDPDGLAIIGQDPFLRQKYAHDVKKTVEIERWVTSWINNGGSLTE